MRSPASAWQTTAAADQMQPIWLVEFQASTVVRYAFYAQDVTFATNVYTATDGEVGTIKQTAEAKAPANSLTMQNIDRVLRDWLDAEDRRGIDVVLRLVFADNLSDSTAALEVTYELDAYRFDTVDVEFDLVATPLVRGMQVPGRRVQGWYCPWSYKGTECGYVGDIATCDFTYADCRRHFGTDPKRFGGFLGRPQADLVVL